MTTLEQRLREILERLAHKYYEEGRKIGEGQGRLGTSLGHEEYTRAILSLHKEEMLKLIPEAKEERDWPASTFEELKDEGFNECRNQIIKNIEGTTR